MPGLPILFPRGETCRPRCRGAPHTALSFTYYDSLQFNPGATICRLTHSSYLFHLPPSLSLPLHPSLFTLPFLPSSLPIFFLRPPLNGPRPPPSPTPFSSYSFSPTLLLSTP